MSNRFTHLSDWLSLPDETKIRIFDETSRQIGLPSSSAIEKDWWVVHTLSIIFSMKCVDALVFKGGTSLSKGWNLIDRFSEDIDLALDREFLGFKGNLTTTQIRKLRKASYNYITSSFAIELTSKFDELGFKDVVIKVREVEHHDQDPIVVEIYYNKLTESDVYLKPGVIVEIGSRSLREPFTHRSFSTYVSEIYPKSLFADTAINIPIVNPERTFLEKIFLLHQEFQKPIAKIRVDRLSRHLYDIEKLSQTHFAETALSNAELYNSIVKHRGKFNAIKHIDYLKHNPASIRFIPPKDVIKKWQADYEEMKVSMVYKPCLDFDELINRLLILQNKINDM
jgi:predicted nucleotidyltransferase component of viral defense system